MNLLLLEPDELDPTGRATVRGRRAEHAASVLRAEVGQQLKVGVLGGGLGNARIEVIASDHLVLTATFDRPAPPAEDALLLAVPRPKVLLRMLEHAAALGFGEIVLLRTWRVDKSWLGSSAMQPATWRRHLVLGLEQAGRTLLPRVRFFPLFRPFVEDELPALPLPADRFVAHPTASTGTVELALAPGTPFALALGPDGGLLPYEVDRLATAGFLPVHCGRHPLRTETALATLAGQLDLLRRRSSLSR
ncbi:MAG: 16S rRNA (uracil(1498)-N(3))-methyltransferase [Planctomycetes bacterium]|nr:16S rRNA (uracil(1498)-N(3))-methyltransferase [Planctomycetota bacterium]